MDKLKQAIQSLRSKLDNLRKRGLKETPTRTIVIDPLLNALGWDVRDPDEVELEYPTVDGKSVDYALKLNDKPVLLVEAKPLDDPLDEVKGITQVVSYASNDGIVWCTLTNGIKWKVYRSVEKCAAPDKLMYEVSLDPKDDLGAGIDELAAHLWRLSREEMAKGTLDVLGEQTFTDSKVRKALDQVMCDPPRKLLNFLRDTMDDTSLKPQQIKESLARLWQGGLAQSASVSSRKITRLSSTGGKAGSDGIRKTKARRTQAGAATDYGESHHTAGKPQEALALYRAVDDFCRSLDPTGIERRYLAKSINYVLGKRTFCSLHILRGGLRVWLQLKYDRLNNPPKFARDMKGVGHWGTGDLELAVSSQSQLDETLQCVQMSFDACKP